MDLSINRAGEFIAHADAQHPQQCGREGVRHYKYFVTIMAGNHHLTPDGFVMDNAWVDEYFQRCYGNIGYRMKCDSCENMAQRAVHEFHEMFKRIHELKSIDLKRIYVRIHGSDFSFIEAEWKK